MASPRGAAVAALARYLVSAGRSANLVDGAELAADLLGAEATESCEAVTTLLADGWDGTLGALLACARTL